MIPNCIVGDFDSIRSEVQDFFSKKNVKMFMKQDQDTTDLEKCLYVSLEKISEISVETDSDNYNYNFNKYANLNNNLNDYENLCKNIKKYSIVILGASGGRIDHTFSAYSQVFKYLNMYSYEFGETEILMMSKSSCSVYLKPGRNIIYLSNTMEKKNQGFSIIPLFGEGRLEIYEDEEIDKNKSGK
jgi:thiamine pyrophosphokinase